MSDFVAYLAEQEDLPYSDARCRAAFAAKLSDLFGNEDAARGFTLWCREESQALYDAFPALVSADPGRASETVGGAKAYRELVDSLTAFRGQVAAHFKMWETLS